VKALSEDLRVRVVEAREAGESIAKVAERFSVSLSSVKRLRRQIREQGRLDFRSPPGRPARFEGDTLDAFAAQLREHNDWTLKQRTGPEGAVLSKTASTGLASGHGGTGGSVHPAPDVSKVELDLEKKRNAPLAGRPHGVPFCPRQRNEAARWQFLAQLQQIDPYKVVLFDETGTRLGMTPARARSPKGERAHSPERRNTGKNHTLLSAVSLNGVLPDLLLEGGVNRISFEFYLEHLLLPQMQPGQILMLDGYSAHLGGRVRERVEARGCTLLYFPGYSPDFNPIEQVFAKLKAFLRRHTAHVLEELAQTIREGLDTITLQDLRHFFRDSGFLVL